MPYRLLTALLFILLVGCAETVRCPDGEIFGDDGRCEPIGDAGSGSDNGGDGG